MKDSGVEWIGQIPDSWSTIRFKDKYVNQKEIAGQKSVDYERLALTLNGVIKRSKDDSEGLQPKEFDGYQVIHENDFVFKMIDLQNVSTSRVGLSPYVGLVSPAYIRFSPRIDNQYNKFVYYFLMSMYYNYVYNNLAGNGVRGALNATDMGQFVIPYPSIDIQRKIVNLLENKLTQVDNLIVNQQAQIEKLKEYKQAIITEAVTKGLDKTALMKDSFCWQLPKIPMKWKIHKLLYMLAIPITDGPHETPELLIDGIPFVSADSIKNEKIDFSRKRGYISYEYNELISQKYKPQKHDIYMIKSGATTGKVAFVDTDIIFNIWSPLAAIRVNENFYWKYVFYVLQSNYFQKQVRLGWSFGTQQNLSMRVLEQLLIAYPNKVEQQEVADYLDNKCADIDSLISIKQQKIEKLQEYKKSLIYEYVTGKKEVEL